MSVAASRSRSHLSGTALVLLLVGCTPPPERVEQPVSFSHRVHHEQDMGCLDCHLRAEEGVYATLPGLKTCLLCHEEPQGESPEEPKVREYAEREEPIPWVQVNRVEGHVYFSHAVHVKLAGMSCEDCHGDMRAMDEPVGESQVSGLTMKVCMDCHDQRGASNDCLACHK